MRNLFLSFMLIVASSGCSGRKLIREVNFEWFNLSTNEIWVTDLIGLPADASPGRLIPNRAEDQLESSESTFSKTVRIADRITVKWKENEKQSWPGGLQQPGTTPPGIVHEADFNRANLGIPAELSSGKVRFTYLGRSKWRIKVFELNVAREP